MSTALLHRQISAEFDFVALEQAYETVEIRDEESKSPEIFIMLEFTHTHIDTQSLCFNETTNKHFLKPPFTDTS